MPQIFELKKQPGFCDGSSLTDDSLSEVPSDTICLSLENAPITDNGIKRLKNCENLKCIDLDGTKITDESLKTISEMKSVEELWLEQTSITSEGLKHLNKLPKLKFISLEYCEIPQAELDLFYHENPGLRY